MLLIAQGNLIINSFCVGAHFNQQDLSARFGADREVICHGSSPQGHDGIIVLNNNRATDVYALDDMTRWMVRI